MWSMVSLTTLLNRVKHFELAAAATATTAAASAHLPPMMTDTGFFSAFRAS
jgi:hypothetical protein